MLSNGSSLKFPVDVQREVKQSYPGTPSAKDVQQKPKEKEKRMGKVKQ
jgi:hypothetical protein